MASENVAATAARWVDDRLSLATGKKYLRKVFPDHWSFMLGEIALWSFVVLLITGVLMSLWFKPGMAEVRYHGSYDQLRGMKVSEAYASVLHLSFDVRGGLLLRQMHHWAANIFIAGMFVHLIRVFATGAFRKPREVNWLIGCTMLLLGIIEGFAGYSLPDDLLSGTGLRIAAGLMQSVPVVGSYLVFFLFGGAYPGDSIVSRLYIAHVLLLPGLLLALISAHMLILVFQKHTQWPGRGRSDANVVGVPMLPVYVAKSGGFFFVVFGVIAVMGGLLAINPIWRYGPYDPSKATADSQPDWYMGLPEGLLRIMPGVETHVAGHTVMWNVFIPGVLMPMVLFVTLVSYPFLSAWIAGDRAEHHLLQRPWEAPNRTAFLAAMMTLYGLLWAAGGDDVLALEFRLSVNALVWFFRGAVFVGPVLAFMITRRWCVSLQRRHQASLTEGRETGMVTRAAEGGFSEGHAPPPSVTAPAVQPWSRSEAPAFDAGLRGPVRARLARWVVDEQLPLPGPRKAGEVDEPAGADKAGETDHDAAAEDAPVADGHQFDGRRSVVGNELR